MESLNPARRASLARFAGFLTHLALQLSSSHSLLRLDVTHDPVQGRLAVVYAEWPLAASCPHGAIPAGPSPATIIAFFPFTIFAVTCVDTSHNRLVASTAPFLKVIFLSSFKGPGSNGSSRPSFKHRGPIVIKSFSPTFQAPVVDPHSVLFSKSILL